MKINRKNPYSKDLFFCCVLNQNGNQIDLVNNIHGTLDTSGAGTVAMKATPYGLVHDFEYTGPDDWAGFNFGNTGGSGPYEPTGEITLVARCRPGDEDDSGGSRIVSKRQTNGGGDDYALYVFTTTSDNDTFRARVSDTDVTIQRPTGSWEGILTDFALVNTSSSHDGYYWELDTGNSDTDTAVGQTINTSTNSLCIGFREAENRAFDGEIHFVMGWNRALTKTELERFLANPWQLFEPQLIVGMHDLPTDVKFAPLQKPWTSQPPTPVTKFDQDNFFGKHCLFAAIPGWGDAAGDENTQTGSFTSVGNHRWTFTPEEFGTGSHSITTVTKTYNHLGKCRAVAFDQTGSSNGMRLKYAHSASDYGINFPDNREFCIIAIVKPVSDGALGSADPRYFTKDVGFAADNHDYCLGSITAGENQQVARARIRIGAATTSVWTTTQIQNDALNLVVGMVTKDNIDPANYSIVKVGILREDGGFQIQPSASVSGQYNARASQTTALGATAMTNNSNTYEGDVIGVWAFDIAIESEPLLKNFFNNPWQVFQPQEILAPFNEQLPDLVTFEVDWTEQPK